MPRPDFDGVPLEAYAGVPTVELMAALAAVILSYINDPERLAAHGRAARSRAEEHFSLDVMMTNYMQLYDELIGAGSPVTVD